MTDIPDDIRERGIPDDIHATALVRARDFFNPGYAYRVISSAIHAERLATETRMREECAKVAEKIGARHFAMCDRLGDADPETGVSQCSLETRGEDCLCAQRNEAGEEIAAAIREGRK